MGELAELSDEDVKSGLEDQDDSDVADMSLENPEQKNIQVGNLPRRGMIMTTITTSTITTICDRENGGSERESETSPDPDLTQSRPDPDHTCSSLNALG